MKCKRSMEEDKDEDRQIDRYYRHVLNALGKH